MRIYDADNPPPEVGNDISLEELMDAVKDEADMTGSSFLNDNQLIRWINVELKELYDLLITECPDYFVDLGSEITISSDGYAEVPDNYYKCLALYIHNGADILRVRRMPLSDIDRYESTIFVQTDGAYHYRIVGRTIIFAPAPSSGDTASMYYVPALKKLVKQGDRVHISIPIGWEDFVVAGAAARALGKEESDPSLQLQRKAYIKQHIIDMAEHDNAQPDAVVDEYRRFGDDYGYQYSDWHVRR